MSDARQRRFETLLLPVREGLYRFALQLTKDAVRADDLLQHACVLGLTRLDQLSAEGAFRAWMSRIMYRTHLNQRASASATRDAQSDPLDERVVQLPSGRPGPDHAADRQRLAARIEQALGGLRPEQARAI